MKIVQEENESELLTNHLIVEDENTLSRKRKE